jgi:hypothetical protein
LVKKTLRESRKFSEGRKKRMPVKKTSGGYKYGNKGKLYKGKGAKAKAAKQGRAINASKKRR